ncbi:MAG: hypothetical protein EGR08_06565 [Prevotella sp.]|nr:hypothetical protein [Prevotella sp.]
MKRILRSFLTLLMLVVWVSGFAQEVTLDFTNATKDWGITATPTTKATKFTNGTYTIEASNGFKQSGDGVLLGKSGATLTLPAFDFAVEKIVVKKNTGNSQVSQRVKQNIFVGSQAVSTQTTGADKDQTYEIKADYQKAGNIYVLKVTNAYNTQFSKIEIYKAASTKTATTLDFGFTTKTAKINETFTAPATLKAGETTISGAVTYKSSNTKVADVDETTGEVLAFAAGKAKITANYAGSSEYQASTASYELTVVDPNALEVTFDFTDPASLNYSDIVTTELKEGDKFVNGQITLTNKKNGSNTPNRLYKSTSGFYLGVYQEGQMELSAADGYAITGISFTKDGKTLKINGVLANADWSGNAKSLILSVDAAASGTKIKTMTVSFTKTVATPSLSLDENAEISVTEKALKDANTAGSVYDVKLARTLTANVWNTICLPFNVTEEQIADVLKSAGNVKEFDREDASKQTIYFKDATTMVAGKPYLIKPTESAKELVFKGVKITKYSASSSLGNDYGVCGTFVPYKLSTDGTDLFLKTDGKFYVPAEGKETMKGFRAFFIVPNNTTAAALNLSFGDATGINGVAADAEKNVKVYNVNGQYVGTSLEALPKGLYIVGGKKVLK